MAAILDPNGSYNVIGGNSGKKNTYYKTQWTNFAPNVASLGPRRLRRDCKLLLDPAQSFEAATAISLVMTRSLLQ